MLLIDKNLKCIHFKN